MISAKSKKEQPMGGIGSGRRFQGGKATTSGHRELDIRSLQRDGLITSGKSFNLYWSRNGVSLGSIEVKSLSDRIMLNYHCKENEAWVKKEYPIEIDWTNCNLGGKRCWFICPAQGCKRRVAILYDGSIFACRHCYRLFYACQRESPDDRAMRRADKIRSRLGWCAGIANPPGSKPKGMHWRTFNRLTVQQEDFAWRGMARLKKMVDFQINSRT